MLREPALPSSAGSVSFTAERRERPSLLRGRRPPGWRDENTRRPPRELQRRHRVGSAVARDNGERGDGVDQEMNAARRWRGLALLAGIESTTFIAIDLARSRADRGIEPVSSGGVTPIPGVQNGVVIDGAGARVGPERDERVRVRRLGPGAKVGRKEEEAQQCRPPEET